MADIPKRIAIVYDRVNKWGGAERVLLALHEIYPQAPLYTAVYNSPTAPWAKIFPQVIPSFLQYLPYAKTRHELYPWLTPVAFESFDFQQYQAVISVTSADAKAIITRPGTFHLCYCLTPTRYLWSHEELYKQQLLPATKYFTRPLFNYLKSWDYIAAQRPDFYLTISQNVRDRINRYYHRDSQIIYPPVNTDFFAQRVNPPGLTDYFLWVGRLVFQKGLETVIKVFNELGQHLAIVGIGKEENRLKKMASGNIHFLGLLEDRELVAYYRHSRAVIYFHEEDFGLVPLEAHAAGTPVIALNRGGARETVLHGSTGLLIDDSTEIALKQAIRNFSDFSFDRKFIQSHARKFSGERFSREFAKVFSKSWKKYKNTYSS